MKKKFTIKDIAEKAGVSKGAAWAALKEQQCSVRMASATRERIRKVAAELNYRPNILARSLTQQKSYLIGFNFNVNCNLWHHAVQIINGMRELCSTHDYSLVVYLANNAEDEYQNLQKAVDRHLDGLLTIPVLMDGRHNRDEYCRISREVMPVVQVCYPLCQDLPYICHDFRYLAKRATEYLIERGHRRIALVTFDKYSDQEEGLTSFEHHHGYLEAMNSAGFDASVFPHGSFVHSYAADDAYAIAEKVLHTLPRQTAVVASSNSAAFGLIKRWEELGVRVPDDISIIGCANDLDVPACLTPDLTRFESEFDYIGQQAAQLCLQLSEPSTPKQIRLKLKLHKGATVKDV
jgi:DNA-binding LacI/PurR family transcriptional regulator